MQNLHADDDALMVISLKQSIEQDAEQLLFAALSSYRATLAAMGEAASQVDSATGEPLQQALQNLSSGLDDGVCADRISETQRGIEQELRIWATHAADVFGNKANGIQDVLLIAGTAAQQVSERSNHHAKRFTEFTERLTATSKLNDLTIIRHSIGQHSADLKSYVTQMVADSTAAVAQLRAQIETYESRLEEMEHLAAHDSLTGLLNRRKVERHIETRIRAGQTFCVISLDLNGFKQLNDTYGHAAGDDLLRQFATELKTVFRTHDVIGRVGGDEFMVLVDGDLAVAGARRERIQRWVNGRYKVNGNPDAPKVNITAAAGVAEWTRGETMQGVLGRADAAMYEDKRSSVIARAS
jgi:diguanylate cyclase (GGDEF)-like protein